VSICSHERHRSASASERHDTGALFAIPKRSVLDLHTSEVPIETAKLDLTIDQLDLKDSMVNGVLNIYVIQRKTTGTTINRGSGKDAIFSEADYWVCYFSAAFRALLTQPQRTPRSVNRNAVWHHSSRLFDSS
jgi:hypothetical protein